MTAAPLNIQINIGADSRALVSTGFTAGARLEDSDVFDLDFFEKRYESEMDFSRCEGFQDEFMGVRVPMPVPSAKLRKMLAPRTDRIVMERSSGISGNNSGRGSYEELFDSPRHSDFSEEFRGRFARFDLTSIEAAFHSSTVVAAHSAYATRRIAHSPAGPQNRLIVS